MAGFIKADTLWFNGALVPWESARVHVLAHGLHYGTGVFEGVRSYTTPDGTAVFRLDAHLGRLFASAALYEIEIPYSIGELTAATLEVVAANNLGNSYIRPVAFCDAFSLDVWPKGCPVSVAIAGMPRGAYLHGGLERGVRATVSSVRKFDPAAIPPIAKSCGQYVNSVRAVQDAMRRGFDEAILLDARGDVAEGSGENLFIVRDGTLITNGADAAIVMGITREAILEMAGDLGIPTLVRTLRVEDLAAADELFFSGTAVEVTPIRELDGRQIGDGSRGPITTAIQRVFFETVHGARPEYRKWLTSAHSP